MSKYIDIPTTPAVRLIRIRLHLADLADVIRTKIVAESDDFTRSYQRQLIKQHLDKARAELVALEQDLREKGVLG